MKRKDVERLARELVDAISEMRAEMARQDAIIQRQAAEIQQLRSDDAVRLTPEMVVDPSNGISRLRHEYR